MKVGDYITFSGCYHIEARGQRLFEMNSRQRRGMIVQKISPPNGEIQLKVFSENQFCILVISDEDIRAQVVNESR